MLTYDHSLLELNSANSLNFTSDGVTQLCCDGKENVDLRNASEEKTGSPFATLTTTESLTPAFDDCNPVEGILMSRIVELQSFIAQNQNLWEGDKCLIEKASISNQSGQHWPLPWIEDNLTPLQWPKNAEATFLNQTATVQPTGQLAQWSCLQLELWNGYSSFWRHIRTESEIHRILLFAIPRFNREGNLNEMWKSGHCLYRCKGSDSEWSNKELKFLFNDPFNQDKVFYIGLPKDVCPIEFYLKAQERVDYDFPNDAAKNGDFEFPPHTYLLVNSGISTLRDGELVDGDQVTSIGITLYFKESKKSTSLWRNAILHYFDELTGKWTQQIFNPESGEIVFLQAKSLTFVLKQYHADRWLKPNTNGNFRISFPGSYQVSLDGSVYPIAHPRNVFISPETSKVYNLTTLEGVDEDIESIFNISEPS